MIVGTRQRAVAAAIPLTTAAGVLIVKGTLGATSIIVKVTNSSTANAITLTAVGGTDAALSNSITGFALMNLYAAGEADSGFSLLAEFAPNPTTAPKGTVPTIVTPFVQILAAQGTASGTADVEAYPVFASGAGPGGASGGYGAYPLL